MKYQSFIAEAAAALLLMAAEPGGAALTRLDEEAPWPRVRSSGGSTVTLHLPQVEGWTSNSFTARAAVEVKLPESKEELLGVIWFKAQGSVDHSNRLVTLDRFEITKSRFPEANERETNVLAAVQALVPDGARTVSLDYLVAALGFNQAAARQGAGQLNHAPPNIIWTTNRTVLILIDGEPVFRPLSGSSLERVVNTPALLVKETQTGKLYLSGDGRWFAAESIQGPWALVQAPPAAVVALDSGAKTEGAEAPPRITVSTSPTELLMTLGLPDYRPVRGTKLLYAANTDSRLFFDQTARDSYLLLSGRWYKSKSLHGPWTRVAPKELPPDFARIPASSPQGIVLGSVPDTPQADLAVLANSIPTTATVNRREAKLEVSYDGEPQFKPVEGTAMSYAANAQVPVIRLGENYYAVEKGVWFVGSSPKGPWAVATEVPEEIYTIPPGSPVYYATFARVYDSNEVEVEVGYTTGYVGAYEDEGTIVYGTGYQYEPWYGTEYYGWGWTWGYGYEYVPWYQWWVWRPWWNDLGGLRAALIDNIYDRWENHHVVTPHDGWGYAPRAPLAPRAPSAPLALSAPSAGRAPSAPPAGLAGTAPAAPRAPSAPKAPSAGYGHPAQYGRFRGSREAAPLAPPESTLALNPYARPQSSVRPGEVPRGAQRLTEVRQASGGGRDLYASPDGNVYRRSNNGWYRREAGGGWSFYAPTQGRIEQAQTPSVRSAQPSAAAVRRPSPAGGAAGGRAPGQISRVPDSGMRARTQEVANLERQYYARTLATMRAQNWRASAGVSRPVGRRR